MASASFHPGYRVGRYELLSPIARGGMAAVWAARMQGTRGFESLVAVKTILPHLADDPRFKTMFLDEARIAGRIVHPNVAQVFDVGEQDGVLFMVFEWVDGDPLSILMQELSARGERFPVPIALRIMANVCGGLHAAHELCDATGQSLQVVHRDVSPQNIVVSDAGAVKVIDFGVAKALNRGIGETVSGKLKGKVQYMAPEQAMSLSVDRRADVYSVGAVLYHLLSGQFPLNANSPVEALNMLLAGGSAEPLPRDIPTPVTNIVSRAMAYDREDRIQNAADLQVELVMALRAVSKPLTNADVAALVRRHLAVQSDRRHKLVAAAVEAVNQDAVVDGDVTLVDHERSAGCVVGLLEPDEDDEPEPVPLVRRSGPIWGSQPVDQEGLAELRSLVARTLPRTNTHPPQSPRQSLPSVDVSPSTVPARVRTRPSIHAAVILVLAGLIGVGVFFILPLGNPRVEEPAAAAASNAVVPVESTTRACVKRAKRAPAITPESLEIVASVALPSSSSAPATRRGPAKRSGQKTALTVPAPTFGLKSLPSRMLDPHGPADNQLSYPTVPSDKASSAP